MVIFNSYVKLPEGRLLMILMTSLQSSPHWHCALTCMTTLDPKMNRCNTKPGIQLYVCDRNISGWGDYCFVFTIITIVSERYIADTAQFCERVSWRKLRTAALYIPLSCELESTGLHLSRVKVCSMPISWEKHQKISHGWSFFLEGSCLVRMMTVKIR